jgi:hypothetical protein
MQTTKASALYAGDPFTDPFMTPLPKIRSDMAQHDPGDL